MAIVNETWSSHAKYYNPIQIGSIDASNTVPHDHGILRACNASYHPNRLLRNNHESTLFIGRLSKEVVEKDLENLFSKHGKLENVTVVRDIVTGSSKRYAFVEFRNRRDAHLARSKESRTTLNGKEILVDFECQHTLPGWIPRRLGGGFGGKKESGQLRFGCVDRPWKRPLQMAISGRKPKLDAPLSFPPSSSSHNLDGRKETFSSHTKRNRNEQSYTTLKDVKRRRT